MILSLPPSPLSCSLGKKFFNQKRALELQNLALPKKVFTIISSSGKARKTLTFLIDRMFINKCIHL
jgi:hypothetical protein